MCLLLLAAAASRVKVLCPTSNMWVWLACRTHTVIHEDICAPTYPHTQLPWPRQHNSCSADMMVATCSHPCNPSRQRENVGHCVCGCVRARTHVRTHTHTHIHILLSFNVWFQPAMKTVIWAHLCLTEFYSATHQIEGTSHPDHLSRPHPNSPNRLSLLFPFPLYPSLEVTLLQTLSRQEVTEISLLRVEQQGQENSLKAQYWEVSQGWGDCLLFPQLCLLISCYKANPNVQYLVCCTAKKAINVWDGVWVFQRHPMGTAF